MKEIIRHGKKKKNEINSDKTTTTKRKKTHVSSKETATEKETHSSGIWSGTVSFSLVAIPVRLVKAVEPGHISFRMLHSKDYSTLERKMLCPEDEMIVSTEEIIRGYEIEPGRHIMISDEELESVTPERSRTIEIAEFIDINEVDPIYYDHPYFLVPLKGGEKAYRLLAESMQKTGKAGIAKFVLDEREYFVIIKNKDGALEVSTLHYKDEILPYDDTGKEKVKFSDEEKNGIKKIIKEMTEEFTPEKYSDMRREKLLDILKKKMEKKEEVEAPETEEEKTSEGMVDLMEALQESMSKMKRQK
jgi:DNA end-binding protein Ku